MLPLPRLFVLSFFGFSLLVPLLRAEAAGLGARLAGRILLQVEARGEAWYVDPVSGRRFFLGTAEDAYALMRRKGLGVKHETLLQYQRSGFPKRLSGRILLDVEARGEAYYIVPGTLQGIYLGRASDAYALMRQYGLGIADATLRQIVIDRESAPLPSGGMSSMNGTGNGTNPQTPSDATTTAPTAPTIEVSAIERETFDLINAHRRTIGLSELRWNDTVARASREHSQAMADGRVPFGHAGFDERADRILLTVDAGRIGENVALNNWEDRPAAAAVHAWIQSPGHKANIERPSFTASGMGVVQSSDGAYYFTQMFIE